MICYANFEFIIINFFYFILTKQLIAKLPHDANVKGRCVSILDDKPIMDITWRGGFTLRMVFAKVIKFAFIVKS